MFQKKNTEIQEIAIKKKNNRKKWKYKRKIRK